MGTSAANGACQRKWVAPKWFCAGAVQGRSVACSSEKGVQKPFPERQSESTAHRRVMEAILEAGAEISGWNSNGKVHAAHDDSQLACFRTRRRISGRLPLTVC